MAKRAQAFRIILGVIAGCVISFSTSSAEKTGGAAWVFKIEGTVHCRPQAGKELQILKEGVWLQDGAFVKVGQDATASLLMKDSSMVVVHADEAYTVGRTGSNPKTEVASFWANLANLFSGTGGDTSRTASVRSIDKEAIRLLPKSGCLLDTTPILRWHDLRASVPANACYSVSITDASGKSVWLDDKVNGYFVKLPTDKPVLRPGMSYTWKVSVEKSSPPCAVSGSFRVLSEVESDSEQKRAQEQTAHLNNQMMDVSGRHVMLAMYYLNRGLTLEAFQQLEAACAASPESKACRQMRDALCGGSQFTPSQ